MSTAPPKTHAQLVANRHNHDSMPIESPYAVEFSLDADDSSGVPDSYEGVIALDSDVLASLVIQLRTNLQTTQSDLTQVREEREELITALAIAQTKISDLKFEKEDMRKAMADLKTLNEKERARGDGLEKELADAWKKVQEGEEAVAMLRTKVEESRRGLMRLQTEQNRRMSQLTTPSQMQMLASPFATTFDGLPRTPVPGTAGFNKRMSTPVGPSAFGGHSLLVGAPPKGRAGPHRRQSSISEPDVEEANSLSQQQLKSARRHSMLVRPTESLLNPLGAELEALRQELVAARIELDDTQARLKEEHEAREASDVCVKALKEFIAENAIGESSSESIRGLTLPPLPTDEIPDTPPPQPAPKKGWGLASLWGSSSAQPTPQETTPKAKTHSGHPSTSSAAPSAFGRWSRPSSVSSSPATQEDNYTPAPTRGTIGRKMGFFGGSQQGSISSIGSLSLGTSSRSPPRSSYAPSLEERGGSTASSEGPDSPDAKGVVVDHDAVSIVEEDEGQGIVVRNRVVPALDKKSGEVTPTSKPPSVMSGVGMAV